MPDQENEPMIRLEPGGVAPILSYNVPEPTSYSGRNFIDLQLGASYFIPDAAPPPPPASGLSVAEAFASLVAEATSDNSSAPYVRPASRSAIDSPGSTSAKSAPCGASASACTSTAR